MVYSATRLDFLMKDLSLSLLKIISILYHIGSSGAFPHVDRNKWWPIIGRSGVTMRVTTSTTGILVRSGSSASIILLPTILFTAICGRIVATTATSGISIPSVISCMRVRILRMGMAWHF